MRPHAMFKTIRADEVAETWEGVPRELYAKLWNEVVPRMKPMPNLEDNGPGDLVGFENLAAHWKLFTAEEKKLLNGLAKARHEEFEKWWKEIRA